MSIQSLFLSSKPTNLVCLLTVYYLFPSATEAAVGNNVLFYVTSVKNLSHFHLQKWHKTFN